MKLSILFPLTALLSVATAQSACVQNCLQQAGSATGCTDASCACSNQDFKTQVQNCVTSKCSSADQQSAQQLQSQC